MFKNLGDRWDAVKPRVFALVVGLIAGPLITSSMGWQVTAATARTQVHAGVVAEKAMVCATRARAENADAAKLDWSARQDLAKRSAMVVPGAREDYEVTRACADRLAA
jgi:hypothetical protein